MIKRARLRPSPGTVLGTIADRLHPHRSRGRGAQTARSRPGDIASGAVTGKKIASKSIKSGKIADGKIKAISMAPGVIPEVPQQAFGRVNKSGTTAAPVAGAVGITGAASGGLGVICLDLAFVPVSGSATVVEGGGPNRPGATAELTIGTEARRGPVHRRGRLDPLADQRGDSGPAARRAGRPRRLRRVHRRLTAERERIGR